MTVRLNDDEGLVGLTSQERSADDRENKDQRMKVHRWRTVSSVFGSWASST